MKSSQSHYSLTVKDNGVGFAPGVDFRKTSSLGMEIVCILTEQIKGSIDLVNENGSTFVIAFPKKAIDKE
jgi:two-component sensor histidine kinase